MTDVTHPEKTLVARTSVEDIAALGVVGTGLLAMSCSTGWQVAWLVVLAVVAGMRRWGRRFADTLGSFPVQRPDRGPGQGPDTGPG